VRPAVSWHFRPGKSLTLSGATRYGREPRRLSLHLFPLKYNELRAPSSSEDSAAVRQRLIAARDRQLERFHGEKKTYANAQMMPKMIREHCSITPDGEKLLGNPINRLGLSARAHDRILNVARTIADLDGNDGIEPRHLERGDSISHAGSLLLDLAGI
jgi:predicted ATPase with chaperone activity